MASIQNSTQATAKLRKTEVSEASQASASRGASTPGEPSLGAPNTKKLRKTEGCQTTTGKRMMSLVHSQGISLDHLRKITNQLADDGNKISTHLLREIAHARFAAAQRVLPLPMDEGEHSWLVADPSLLVPAMVRSSAALEEVFATALQRHPGTQQDPWHLLITWDEFTPGSVLKPNNHRKSMVVNMSFRELGRALNHDCCWWTIAVVRSSIIAKVKGGWPRMLRDLLHRVLLSPTGLQTVGLGLQLKGDFANIYCEVGCMLSDGDGLRLALQWKGPASIHPCFRHWNVLRKDSRRAEHNSMYVEIACEASERFKAWTSNELTEAVDVTAEAHRQSIGGPMTATRLKEVQKHLGFRATPEGLLPDPVLRRHIDWMKVLRYDWAHTFLGDGVLGADMWQLIEAAEKHRLFRQQDVQGFLQEKWMLPVATRHKQRDLWRIFSESGRKVNESCHRVKAGMSDLLGLYGLLRHFVEVRVPAYDGIAVQLRIFQLGCASIDLLLQAKRHRIALRQAGAKLQTLLEEHLHHPASTPPTSPPSHPIHPAHTPIDPRSRCISECRFWASLMS